MSVTVDADPAWRWASPNLVSSTLQQGQCLEKVRRSYPPHYWRIGQTDTSKIKQTAVDLITLLEDFGSFTDPLLGTITDDELWAIRSLCYNINHQLDRLFSLQTFTSSERKGHHVRDGNRKATWAGHLGSASGKDCLRHLTHGRPRRKVCSNVTHRDC